MEESPETPEATTISLTIDGLGIIVYSPSSAEHIADGEDYFSAHFMDEAGVQRHLQDGSIAAFSTSSPGVFLLRTHPGYPTQEQIDNAGFALRLAVRSDGTLVFRDLFDLMEWSAHYPPEQAITAPAGIYHITLLSDRPASGILGDEQAIEVFLQPLDDFPELAREGIPMLCY